MKKVLAAALVTVVGEWAEQPDSRLLEDLVDRLKEFAEVDLCRPPDSIEYVEAFKRANIVAGPSKVDKSLLESADSLEMIQVFGIGYDYIDVDECTKKGIIVCNVPEIYSEPVAQHAWALILDLSKKVTLADRSIRMGQWKRMDWIGVQLWGKTLGVIGLGGIGSRVALKGRLAFNMNVLAFDPFLLPERAQLFGAELTNLDTVLRESDVVVICVPLTAQTHHMIGEEQLSKMKNSAFLVNVSRGQIVDPDALIKSLRMNLIAGAGLDVTEPEPLPGDSPLLHMDNVVLTPHIASSTLEAVEKTYVGAVENIIRYLKGERPNWIVNPSACHR
ncbi:MAG: 2-hydroxyacid dehydrogenase [Nitrososphaeria archaeon]